MWFCPQRHDQHVKDRVKCLESCLYEQTINVNLCLGLFVCFYVSDWNISLCIRGALSIGYFKGIASKYALQANWKPNKEPLWKRGASNWCPEVYRGTVSSLFPPKMTNLYKNRLIERRYYKTPLLSLKENKCDQMREREREVCVSVAACENPSHDSKVLYSG